jgi:predicted nucleic acid-binding protein
VNAVVLDASAAVEMVTRTEAGAQLNRIVPANTSWWVPNGLFDAEVNSVLRRLSLAGTFDDQHIDSARRRLSALRCRRVSVVALADRAWAMRHNLSFYDACYVALADVLRAPLVTVDMKLANAPGLSVETIHP